MSTSFSDPEFGPRSVTVVIAAKDAQDTIGRAVASCLAQPDACEVIVVDDGSSDDTAGAARAKDDGSGRLSVIKLDQNQGPAAARNIALNQAKGVWYTMVDSDDFLDEGRLASLLDVAGEDYDFVADDLWLVDEGNEDGPRRKMWDAPPEEARCPLTFEYFLEGNIAHKDRIRRELGFIKPIIRRSSIEKENLRYKEHMRLSEDLIFYCELFLSGARSLLVEPTGYVAVRRANSLSGRHGTEELAHYYHAVLDLQKRPGLSPTERRVLARFRNSVARRYRWSRLIDAKKSKNLGEAVACFATSPDIIAMLIKNVVISLFSKIRSSEE